MTNKCVQEESVLFLDDLKKLFNRDSIILRKLLHMCHTSNETVKINNKEKPLVKVIYDDYQPILTLNNHPKVISAFKNFCKRNHVLLNTKPKRNGMLAAVDLQQLYPCSHAFFSQVLKSCYLKKETFEINGEERPLVEMCHSGSQQILALNEDAQALEIFKNICQQHDKSLDIFRKQNGMLSAADLAKMYKRPPHFFEKLMEKCDQENVCFTDKDNIQQKIIQKVKSGSIILPVISNHPEALSHFIGFAAQNNIFLKKSTNYKSNQPDFLKIIQEKLKTSGKINS